MINTAEDMCKKLVQLMEQRGMRTSVVNDVHTNDSKVEHVIDVDVVTMHGYRFDVHITVCRFSKA